MKGRHENAVKNRYISIIRSLKKNDKQIDLNDIYVIIESFKLKNIDGGFPIKKVKLNKNTENCQINLLNFASDKQITKPIIEAEATLSTKNILLNENMEISLIFDNKEITSLHLIPEINESKNLIFDISNYIVPNIYKKKFQQENVSLDSPKKKKWEKKYLNLIIQDEVDDISLKISSMSLSDQLLIEANKILSSRILSISLLGSNSQNSNFHHSFGGKEFFQYSSSNFSNEKSFNFSSESEDKKNNFLIPSINDPNFFDNWNLCSSPQNRLLKSRTSIHEKTPMHADENSLPPFRPEKKKSWDELKTITKFQFFEQKRKLFFVAKNCLSIKSKKNNFSCNILFCLLL